MEINVLFLFFVSLATIYVANVRVRLLVFCETFLSFCQMLYGSMAISSATCPHFNGAKRRRSIWSSGAQHTTSLAGRHGPGMECQLTRNGCGASWRGLGLWPAPPTDREWERERESCSYLRFVASYSHNSCSWWSLSICGHFRPVFVLSNIFWKRPS